MKNIEKLPGFLPAILVIAVVLIILIPFPAMVLDILILLNLIKAFLILLIVLNTKKITDFSLFPTVLLMSTIFGLAINISSVRLILTKGADFDGLTIGLVSSIAAGSGEINSLIVGFAGFIVFAAVVVLVIAKGATRVSEVAACLSLDSMQSKMLAVETEYSSGSIIEEEARKRKTEIQKESDFYCAMDGAVKFISGNVKMTIFIITAIIAGGIAIDTLMHGIAIYDAAKTYIPLSIANGVLFLLPDFLVLLAAEIAVTRLVREDKVEEETTDLPPIDALSLELGYGLIPLVDKDKEAEFAGMIRDLRRQIAYELGLIIPKVRILDSAILDPDEYCIKIKGVEAGRGRIDMETDSSAIIAAHLTDIIKHHAAEILGLQEIRKILEVIKENQPALVDEVTGNLTLEQIQRVLQNLLREQIPIRNMTLILEALAEYGSAAKYTQFLTKKVREALAGVTPDSHA